MAWLYLELADYLVIAEEVLAIPASTLARLDRIDLAESALNAPAGGFGGVEAYPDFETKAAVLLWHLVKNHPLPDGNKRCAFLCVLEFAARNGRRWRRADDDPADTDEIIRGVASDEVSQEELLGWISERLGEEG